MRTQIILFGVWLLISFDTSLYAQKTAVDSFEDFWQIFNQRYASFEEKGIDWQKVYDLNRPKVSENTTDQELFQIMTVMLKPLRDAHTSIKAAALDTSFSASRPSRIMDAIRAIPGAERKPGFYKMVQSTLTQHDFNKLQVLGPEFRGDALFRFTDNGRVGYVQTSRSFTKKNFMTSGLTGYLDEIFNSFETLEGLIVDVRFNIGGDDRFSRKLAGRFTDQEFLGYQKQTRTKGEFGKMKQFYIEPTGSYAFEKPVILLTNDRTVSAADVFAMIMAELPHVTLMGEPSNGSYSDILNHKLPNGWKLTLSHQRYLSADKKNYEGLGTPVDIPAENLKSDWDSKGDRVLESALEILEEKIKKN